MDLYFLYHGQRFVWDPEKASGNAAKHGVRFETACEVFFDPFTWKTQPPARNDVTQQSGSLRIGLCYSLSICFREGETIRIISARPATAQERRAYEDSD
jgi:uncharacterized protein